MKLITNLFNPSWWQGNIINIDDCHSCSKFIFLSTNIPYLLLCIYFSDKEPILSFLFLMVFLASLSFHSSQCFDGHNSKLTQSLLIIDMFFSICVFLYMSASNLLNTVGHSLSFLILPFLLAFGDNYLNKHSIWHIGTAFIGYYAGYKLNLQHKNIS